MIVKQIHRHWPGSPPHERSRLLELATAARDGEIDSFGEPVRLALGVAIDRIRAEMRGGELTECLAVLNHLRSGLDALTPSALSKPRGFAGLFSGRKRRLRAFRARFAEATRTLSESLDDLQLRRSALSRRSDFGERMWGELRASVLDIDAHALAAAAASGDSGDSPQGRRAFRLAAARDCAVRVLPQIRSAQNADAEAARRIKAACETLMEWHVEWRSALGMDGQDKRGRARPPSERLRPDLDRLNAARDTTLSMLDTTAREVEFARKRRLEADARIEAARQGV